MEEEDMMMEEMQGEFLEEQSVQQFPSRIKPAKSLDHSSIIKGMLENFLDCDFLPTFQGISDYSQALEERETKHDENVQAQTEVRNVADMNLKVIKDAMEEKLPCTRSSDKVDISQVTAKQFNLIRFEDIKSSYKEGQYMCGPTEQVCASDKWDGLQNRQTFHPPKKLNALVRSHKTTKGSTVIGREKNEENCVQQHVKGFFDLDLSPGHSKWDEIVRSDVMKWDPEVVVFENFSVGKEYLKKLRLTNVSNRLIKFEIHMDKRAGPQFDVVYSRPMVHHFSLAPGIQMSFSIKFKCKDTDDHKTYVHVSVFDGSSFRIGVRTKRLAPTLISEKFLYPPSSGLLEFKKCATITLDCGTSLLGSVNIISSVLYNVGSESTFMIISERAWELSEIPKQSEENTMSCPPFIIKPAIFRLKPGESVTLNVTFIPISERLHIEKLVVVCDNFAARSIDVIGEAVVFDPLQFSIQAQPFQYSDEDQDEEIDSMSDCVDFGAVRKNSSTTREIQVKSECPVDVELKWEVRKLPNWFEDFNINRSHLLLAPKINRLCASTTEEMEITCVTPSLVPGIYKCALWLVGKNIPRTSIKNICSEEEESETEIVNVDITSIELTIKVKELEIILIPPSIEFNGEPFQTEDCSVQLKNLCDWDVEISCLFPDETRVYFKSSEATAVLPAKETITFTFQAVPLVTGPFEEIIRFECTDEDKYFQLLVKGDVSGEVLESPSIHCEEEETVNVEEGLAEEEEVEDVTVDRQNINLNPFFYKRVPVKFTVTLINRGYRKVDFFWGSPQNPESKHVFVEYSPERGNLEPRGRQEVTVIVTVHRHGLLTDLLLPCFLVNESQVLFINCNGFVQDVQLRISYATLKEMIEFEWPRESSTVLNVSEDLDMKDESCCVCFISKFSDAEIPASARETEEARDDKKEFSIPPIDYWPLVGGFFYADDLKDEAMKREFYHNWDIEHLKRRMVTLSPDEKSEVVKAFSNHALVFRINAYQTNNVARIKIDNLTPIKTQYEVELQEFVECDRETIYKDRNNCPPREESKKSFIKVFRGEENRYIDDLCEKIQPEAGLLLTMKYEKGPLCGNESVEVEVSAFSNCWGIYFDRIVIRVPELPPAIIPVLVIVEGPPVWFTMEPPLNFQPSKREPTIRFYEVFPKSTVQQTVYVYNDSFLPLKLVWTTYVRRPPQRTLAHLCLPDEAPDFSLNIELHPVSEETFCNIQFIDGYGDVDSVYYDVEPRIMRIKPKEKLPLTVRLNTRSVWFDLNHKINYLNGTAHAYVYVDQSEQMNPGRIGEDYNVYRPNGPELEPLLLRMMTKLAALPLKILHDSCTAFIYTVKMSDIVGLKNKIYSEEREYFFQNTSDTLAIVNLDTSGNLYLRSAHINGESLENRGDGIRLALRAHDIIKIKTVLKVSEGDLPCVAGAPLTNIVMRHMDALDQIIPIQINVVESKIELSVFHLDFGNVYLGDSKVLVFRLRSLSGAETFTCRIVSNYNEVFRVFPEKGSVPSNKYVNLNVIFRPKECLTYTAKLIVCPTIISSEQRIEINGYGVWNYKNHLPWSI